MCLVSEGLIGPNVNFCLQISICPLATDSAALFTTRTSPLLAESMSAKSPTAKRHKMPKIPIRARFFISTDGTGSGHAQELSVIGPSQLFRRQRSVQLHCCVNP